VSKRTIQKHVAQVPRTRPPGQGWATFLRNHADETWACDFLEVTDLLFRPLFVFILVGWLPPGCPRGRDAPPNRRLGRPAAARGHALRGEYPRFLVRDNDAKYGHCFAQLAEASGIAVVHTPVRAPRTNPIVERSLHDVRHECLDQLLPLGEAHLRRTLAEYVAYFNVARPHQERDQRVPVPGELPGQARHDAGEIVAIPVLGGVHHTDQHAA